MATLKSSERRSVDDENFLRQFRDGETNEFIQLTATDFLRIWKHFDTDDSGYMERSELDEFLRQLVKSATSRSVSDEVISASALAVLRETVLQRDESGLATDKLEMAQIAIILPTDENFLLFFQLNNPLESSVDFIKVWRQYDFNENGYIEVKELKAFLHHLLKSANETSIDDRQLDEYTNVIMELFDRNKDGKLQLSEMSRLLKVKHNFVYKSLFQDAERASSLAQIEKIFAAYDKNKNGTIEQDELIGFAKDILEVTQQDYTLADVEQLGELILLQCDRSDCRRIYKPDLVRFLLNGCYMAAGPSLTDTAHD